MANTKYESWKNNFKTKSKKDLLLGAVCLVGCVVMIVYCVTLFI